MIKYLDETRSKEEVQDLVDGDFILLHFTEWVLNNYYSDLIWCIDQKIPQEKEHCHCHNHQ